jgi:hypothetical protein
MADSEVLFEFTQLGVQMRVAAFDVATGTEVVAIAPLSTSRLDMKRLALAKLERKLGQAAPQPNRPAGKYA